MFLKRSQIFSTNTSTTSQASPQQANNTKKGLHHPHQRRNRHPRINKSPPHRYIPTLYQDITSLTAQPHHHCSLLQPNPVCEPDNISCRSF